MLALWLCHQALQLVVCCCCSSSLFVKTFTYIDVAKNVLINGYFWHKLSLGR
jgi:hypothetical protein